MLYKLSVSGREISPGRFDLCALVSETGKCMMTIHPALDNVKTRPSLTTSKEGLKTLNIHYETTRI